MTQKEEKYSPHGVLFEFEFDSYAKYERGKRWYIIASVIVIFMVVYALSTQNLLFAFLVVLIAFIIFLHSIREPKKQSCFITDSGVHIDERYYPFNAFESFWIVYKPPEIKNLYLEKEGILGSHISVPLGDTDPIEVRRYLRRVVMEDLEQNEEPLIDAIAKILKI